MAKDILKETPSRTVGVSKKYQYEQEVRPSQKLHCGRTGIQTTYGALTDEQIEAMIKAGNNGFKKGEPEQKPKP